MKATEEPALPRPHRACFLPLCSPPCEDKERALAAGTGSQASASGTVSNDVLSKPLRLWSAALAAWLTGGLR